MAFLTTPGKLTALIAVVALGHTPLTAAQSAPAKFEITPFAAYRVGGDFKEQDGNTEFDLDESSAYGFMVNGRVAHNTQWEFLFARQDTEVDTQGLFVNDPLFDLGVEYYHVGGTYLFDGTNTRPFIAMTLGMSRFDPGPSEFDPESFFSASLGAGLQMNATKRLGVRLEARVFTTFIDGNSEIFCASNAGTGSCLIIVDSTTLSQWEARAGLVFRF